jgi:hypothetical protein
LGGRRRRGFKEGGSGLLTKGKVQDGLGGLQDV